MNYKKMGIAAFLRYEFSLAKDCFSLAYSQKNSEELLFLIDLSQIAQNNQEEALFIFDLYLLKFNEIGDFQELNKIINEINLEKVEGKEEIDVQSAISYTDFKSIVSKEKDFKKTFENIIFSTKIAIMGKDELLNFLEDLISNDFTEMGLSYIETAVLVYGSDDRILNLIKKIKNNDNKFIK